MDLSQPASHPQPTSNRMDTGVAGLNDILMGGLPSGQMYLLEGDPGTGKTTLAMQFIMAGIRLGERALYITLSEPRSELQSSALSHGWDLEHLPIAEFVPSEAGLQSSEQYTVFHPIEVELVSTIANITGEVDRQRPDRVVIDSLSELRLLAADVMRYRRQLLALKQFFVGRNTTVLLLDDRSGDGNDLQLQSIAHGVLRLENVQRSFGVTRRHMEIIKLRGSAYREGFHDYTIRRGGLTVYPRLIAAEHEISFSDERMKSGVDDLDRMFGGGISRGTTTLVTGPSGVGKSTLAAQYAYAAAQRGQRAIIYAFDEMVRTATSRAESLGISINKEIERGTLSIAQIDPAELSPGEFIWQIRSDVRDRDTRVVVIDGLNGFLNSMPGEKDLILHLHELLAFLNQSGVITFLVLTQQGLVGSTQADIDVSYLSDTIVLLRYFEIQGQIRQVLSILKQRIGAHERTLRELTFNATGVHLGEPLRNFRGVLTGVPEFKDPPAE